MTNISRLLVTIGFVLIIVGLLVGKASSFTWLFNLPGDIKVNKENLFIFIPLTSMLLLSGLVSLIYWLLSKILK